VKKRCPFQSTKIRTGIERTQASSREPARSEQPCQPRENQEYKTDGKKMGENHQGTAIRRSREGQKTVEKESTKGQAKFQFVDAPKQGRKRAQRGIKQKKQCEGRQSRQLGFCRNSSLKARVTQNLATHSSTRFCHL
jgi:hypothetical protein